MTKSSDRIKKQILNALGDKKRVIHIEICKSEYMEGKLNLRIGDIKGSTELSNVSLKQILSEIEDEIGSL